MFRLKGNEGTSPITTDEQNGYAGQGMTRREFLSLTLSFAAYGLTDGLDRSLRPLFPDCLDSPEASSKIVPQEGHQCYIFSYGATETLSISPQDPRYREFYAQFIEELRDRERATPARDILDLMQIYTETAYAWYLRYNTDRGNPYTLTMVKPGEYPQELAERAEAGVFRCYEATLLLWYGLTSRNLQAAPVIIGFVSDGLEGAYVIHSNLEVWFTDPRKAGARREPFVLEATNGTVMERREYYAYLNDVFKIAYGIVNRAEVKPTGDVCK